jgi:hypothetical protein
MGNNLFIIHFFSYRFFVMSDIYEPVLTMIVLQVLTSPGSNDHGYDRLQKDFLEVSYFYL